LLAQQNKGAGVKADPRDQHAPSAGHGHCRRKDAAADLSFLLLEQAQILDGELPEDPAAFAARLNRLVLRGMA
jgi:molecular chaperone HtpG